MARSRLQTGPNTPQTGYVGRLRLHLLRVFVMLFRSWSRRETFVYPVTTSGKSKVPFSGTSVAAACAAPEVL